MSVLAPSLSCGRTLALRSVSPSALLLLAACASCAEGSTPDSNLNAGNAGAGNTAAGAGGAAEAGSSGMGSSGMGNAGMGNSAGAGGVGEFRAPWDWAGIVGTGQSLAVGEPGPTRNTPEGAVRSTQQPFNNLKLSTGSAAWPVDPNDPSLSLLPLTEPVGRLATGYPSSWPTNISGETPHSAMGNQVTTLVQASEGRDYVSVHGEVGENGQCLSFLVKGAMPTAMNPVGGHAYEATLIEARAITRLAQAADRTYGVAAITVTHGECDAGNAAYAQQLHQLWSDYAADLAAITGQTEPPILIVSQQNAVNDRAASTLAQWRVGVDYPNEAVCSGPKYQYPYTSDAVHLMVAGYQQLGEKYGQVYYERVVMGRNWQPLQPTAAAREGRVIRVEFHVPVPPLVWEESFQSPHQSGPTAQWSAGKGFEVRAGGAPVAISSVEISGDAVLITCDAELPATGVTVGYALTANAAPLATPFAGTTRWGQLRDSDPFVGSSTLQAQPNFAVAFELPVP